jgi:hypothetical protein
MTNASKIYVRTHYPAATCRKRKSDGICVVMAGIIRLGVGETPREAWDLAAESTRIKKFAKALIG